MTKSANPAMTDTAPSVQPVRAWAIRARDGSIVLDTRWSKADTEDESVYQFGLDENARVIRVEIKEVNDE